MVSAGSAVQSLARASRQAGSDAGDSAASQPATGWSRPVHAWGNPVLSVGTARALWPALAALPGSGPASRGFWRSTGRQGVGQAPSRRPGCYCQAGSGVDTPFPANNTLLPDAPLAGIAAARPAEPHSLPSGAHGGLPPPRVSTAP